MSAPKFRKGKLKHKVPLMPKDKFVVATWTNYNCSHVSKTMTLREAFQLYQDSINKTRIDQVVGILDHKRRTVVRTWGNKHVSASLLQAQIQ